MHDLTPDGNSGAVLSSISMVGVFAVFGYMLAKLVGIIRRLRAQGRAADEATKSGAVLAEGPSVVTGTAEFEEGAEYAVIVEIRQRGTQQRARRRGGKKGSYSHRWEEVERRCFAQPFWIRHASGERVRVEPGQDVELVDRLDVTVHDEPRERFRIAELSVGEEVVAQGTLMRGTPLPAKGYREAGAREWVLVQGDAARLHISAEQLGARHRRRARTYMKRLVFGWLPSAAVALLLYAPHILRMSVGTPSSVVVSSVQAHFAAPDFTVRYELDGTTKSEPVTLGEGESIEEGEQVAFIAVSSYPSAGQIGSSSTTPYVALFVALLFALCAYLVFLPPLEEWYGTKKFKERRHGKLPLPKPSKRKVRSRV